MPAFNHQQRDELATICGLGSASVELPLLSIDGVELLAPEVCRNVLDELGPLLGSPSQKITASLLSKRIAFLTTASCLYPMTAYDVGLDLSLENTVIDYSHDSRLWSSKMFLHDLTSSEFHSGKREIWRKKLCKQLFSGNLSRLWQVFNEVSGIQLSILWENTAVRVYSLYEKRLGKNLSSTAQNNIQGDFDYLLDQTNSTLFDYEINPLSQFYFDKTKQNESTTRYRETCCYYYATGPKEYCSNCPLPLEKEKKRHA